MQHDPSTCQCPCHVQCVHRSNASSRKQTPVEPCKKVVMLIRFAEHKYQRYLNAITSVKSIMMNYGGKSFGVVDHIKRLGGSGWQDGYLVGVCMFDDMQGAKFWYRSDTFCNQPDWLDDTDIIAVPLKKPLEKFSDRRSVFLMGNYFVEDEICFQSEFVDKVEGIIRAGGAEVIADYTKPERIHGSWNAGRFFMVQSPDEPTLIRIVNSDEMMAAQDACDKTSCGCTMLMMTDTNMPGTPSHKKTCFL